MTKRKPSCGICPIFN
ncbi:MAG: hypothetical protein ACFFAS_10185 [Promethearchaeota archaeon]